MDELMGILGCVGVIGGVMLIMFLLAVMFPGQPGNSNPSSSDFDYPEALKYYDTRERENRNRF